MEVNRARKRLASDERALRGSGIARVTAAAAALFAVLITAAPAAAESCTSTIMQSPRAGSQEVQAKAVNDLGDVAGFSDAADGSFHAGVWPGGDAAQAIDLGVPPGYASSEA